MTLKRSPHSDAMCNAALRAALDPFMSVSPEFDVTSGPGAGVTWRAVEGDSILVFRLRTDGERMSSIRAYEGCEPLAVAGFGEGEGWAEIVVSGTTLRSPMADDEVKAWISELEDAARASHGKDFVMGGDHPSP